MNVQRIKYERTGGFTGMRFHADFNPGDLPEEQARPLLDLLEKVNFENLPENMTGSMVHPDQFSYTITVQSSREEHTVIVGDSSAPNEMQELLRMLDSIARSRMKRN
jgi:hypothetical protein